MQFGDYITRKRQERRMSQKELADFLDISYPYMCDIEKDKRSPKGQDIIENIAYYLKLDPDYLYYLTDQIPVIDRRRLDEEQFKNAYSAFRETRHGL